MTNSAPNAYARKDSTAGGTFPAIAEMPIKLMQTNAKSMCSFFFVIRGNLIVIQVVGITTI